MKKYTLFLTILISGCFLQAQNLSTCMFDHGIQELEKKHPGYIQVVNNIFEKAKKSVRNRTGEVYTIPVVVHIVWQDPEENLPDSQVEAQIEVLNKAFRRLNSNANEVRPEFEDVVGDAEIEFDLHKIVRVQTTVDFKVPDDLSYFPDEMKFTDKGGSDAFDTEKFMNIWVCKLIPPILLGLIESPVLGFAYPPVDQPNWPLGSNPPSPEHEGIVINYKAFGINNLPIEVPSILGPSVSIPVATGRIAVHETGHYLGLKHIWGISDSVLSILGLPDCTVDDCIDDTPNQGNSSNYTCVLTQNTCNDGSGDLPDMIENYMDYSLEGCQNSFTKGQIEVMRGVLEGPRRGLINATVGTELLKENNRLQVFPNPFENEITIQIAKDLEPIGYELIDQTGYKVLAEKLQGYESKIEIPELSPGIYTLIINTEQHDQMIRRLIKI